MIVYQFAIVTDLIVPPDLSQARVNKCLIALVNRKVVRKDNATVGSFLDTSTVRLILTSLTGDCSVPLARNTVNELASL